MRFYPKFFLSKTVVFTHQLHIITWLTWHVQEQRCFLLIISFNVFLYSLGKVHTGLWILSTINERWLPVAQCVVVLVMAPKNMFMVAGFDAIYSNKTRNCTVKLMVQFKAKRQNKYTLTHNGYGVS